MRQATAAALAALLTFAWPAVAPAEGPVAYPDFTFKRIGPPKPGSAKRITVQIAPQDIERRKAPPRKPEVAKDPDGAAAAAEGAASSPGRLAWFWDDVSPRLVDAGPGRLEPALRRIAGAPAGAAVPTPRLGQLMDIARQHGADILMTTAGTRVSPALVLAVIAVESSGRVDAVSSAGAEGLMQLMPATAARFGVDDSRNAAKNIRGGVAYLDMLMTQFGGDPILVLAGYNAGENSIGKYDGVPPYAETRDYVPKVLAAFEVARSLCRTRPELISDGCVFSFPS